MCRCIDRKRLTPQDRTVEVAVAVQGKAVAEASLGHLKGDVFDGFELVLDFLVVFFEV